MRLINGYETTTTFWEDFSIADRIGKAAIKDTYNRAFREWKNNYKYLTELVLVLNLKIWENYVRNNEDYMKLYNHLWEQTDLYVCENLKGEELMYFYEVTD